MEKQTEAHTDTDTTDNNLSIVREDTEHVGETGCGERSPAAKQTEKQEWSFTLYDLEGQGRVTKEEVAQLLKSLYDAVGSSIDLPQTGTKTVKLHLTVSPDKPKPDDEPGEDPEPTEEVDVNCKECNSDKDKGQDQKKDINSKLNNGVAAAKLANKRSSWDVGPLKVELPNNLSKANKESHVHGSMKRISPLEQKQLAELVKMNMQRNKEKKLKHNQTQPSSKHRHSSAVPLSHILENPDRRSYYLDLAGIENPTTFSFPMSPNQVTCATLQPVKLRTKSKGASHRRGRDRTVSQGHVLTNHIFGPVDAEVTTQEPTKHTRQHRLSSPKAAGGSPSTPAAGKTKGTSSPRHRSSSKTASSPQKHVSSKSSPKHAPGPTLLEIRAEHGEQVSEQVTSTPRGVRTTLDVADPSKHRKHKKKDKNHVRAMLQVAKWIEKEHQQGLEHVTVEKHEHHHFHEHHHHHHYHHYYQAS